MFGEWKAELNVTSWRRYYSNTKWIVALEKLVELENQTAEAVGQLRHY